MTSTDKARECVDCGRDIPQWKGARCDRCDTLYAFGLRPDSGRIQLHRPGSIMARRVG